MEKNVNRVPRVRVLDIGIELQARVATAAPNGQSKGACALASPCPCFLVYRRASSQPYLVNRQGVTIAAMKLSSWPLRRSPMGLLQHQYFQLMRRCCSLVLAFLAAASVLQPMTFFPLLFCIYLFWSSLRHDGTTGERVYRRAGGSRSVYRMEPQELRITPSRPFY